MQQPFETGRNGIASMIGGYAHIGRKAQEIAGEFAKISEENIGAGSKAAERLRDAKSLQDITSIQTDLMKASYETLSEHCRKIAEIAASTPKEMAEKYQEFFAAMTEAGGKATQQAADMGRDMGRDLGRDLGLAATEKGANVAQKSMDATRDTARKVS
jgi:hypothetical protein